MARNLRSPFQTVAVKSVQSKKNLFYRYWISVGLALIVSACESLPKKAQPTPAQKAVAYSALLNSERIADGSLVLINVAFVKAFSGGVQARFEGKQFQLYPIESSSEGSLRYQGFFGVPHGHAEGLSKVEVLPEGFEPTRIQFQIVDAKYPSETLKVDNRKVNPRKKDLIRIKKELEEVNEVYRLETPARYWSSGFQAPMNSVLTDHFGVRRLYNGQLRSYHGGLDFKAAIGTPIHASAAGKVVLAKDLFYSGGTVILDHGYGLLTMYFHMSQIGVKKGDLVSSQQVLGLSGKTGRVTGPHLHFQTVVHQVKFNPLNLLEGLK